MRDDYKPILKLALKGLQIGCWVGYGIVVSIFVSILFGVMPQISPLLLTLLPWLIRGICIFAVFWITATFIEAIG